jgi:serine/threonine protein kinase
VKSGDTVGTYLLEQRLGKGVTASTWLAKPAQSEENGLDEDNSASAALSAQACVLKIFDIAETSSWKPLDQFRREADILRTLNHPRIPKYIESFETTTEEKFLFVLVMEYIEGDTVEAYLASGKKFTEKQIEELLAELADILAYLGSLRPPIVHRDINPRNLIIRPDGHIVLVDFSGVQDAIRTALYPGATLVGTAGYIPMEQVSGRATHRSDLYGAAATTVFMLTGRNPSELPMRNLKIDLSGLLYMSPRLSFVLDNWLDPDPDRRTLSAIKAAAVLREKIVLPSETRTSIDAKTEATSAENNQNGAGPSWSGAFPRDSFLGEILHNLEERTEQRVYPSELPSNSQLIIQDLAPGLYIKMPKRSNSSMRGGTIFPIAWMGFVFFWTTMTLRMHAPFFFPLFSIPFWIAGFSMIKALIGPSMTETELFLTSDGLLRKSSGFLSNSAQQCLLSDIREAKVRKSSVRINRQYVKELTIKIKGGTINFGLGLSDPELYYLEKRFNEELGLLRQLPAQES